MSINESLQKIKDIRKQYKNTTKTLYHGSTINGIDSFSEPTFFTDDKTYACWFAQKNGGTVYEVNLNLEKTLFINTLDNEKKLLQILNDLNIEFNYDINLKKENIPYFFCSEISKHSKWEGNSIMDTVYIPSVKEKIKKMGYDSLFFQTAYEESKQEIWIVLESSKIFIKNKQHIEKKINNIN